MSVQQINGDLLAWSAGINTICHVVSCKGVAGAGIAKSLREAHPEAFEPYFAAHSKGELTLGEFIVGKAAAGQRIVHLVGQRDIGTHKRQLDYEAFYSGMETLRDVLEEAGKDGRPYTLGVPWGIGCGLAGGDWSVVESMIQSVFHESAVPIVIVKKTS